MPTMFPTAYGPISSITNYFSSGGVSTTNSIASNEIQNSKEALSGSLTAATLATVLTKTGRGRVNLVTAYTKDSTSRTVRLQLIVDGVTVFDATSNAIVTSGAGIVALGVVNNNGALEFQPVDYQTSFQVKVASSLTETNKIGVGLNYEDWQ